MIKRQPVRSISLLTLSLLTLRDSKVFGNPLWTWEFHPLKVSIQTSNPAPSHGSPFRRKVSKPAPGEGFVSHYYFQVGWQQRASKSDKFCSKPRNSLSNFRWIVMGIWTTRNQIFNLVEMSRPPITINININSNRVTINSNSNSNNTNNVNMYTCIYTYIYIYIYTHICMYVYILYIYIYIYIYTYIHT